MSKWLQHLFIASMALSALLVGCAAVDTVREAPESAGEQQYFEEGYERTVEAVAETLPLLGLEGIERQSTRPGTTVFIGTHESTIASWGEIVRVIVTELGTKRVSVRVHWRSYFRDGLITSAPDWVEEVFEGISEALN